MAGKIGRVGWLIAFAVCVGCQTADTVSVDADGAFNRALSLGRDGRHEESAQAFGDFAARFKDDSRADLAQYRCGFEYAAAGKYDAALVAFDKLFGPDFQHSAYLVDANDVCLRVGRVLLAAGHEKGITFLNAVSSRDPYGALGVAARKELAHYYYHRGRYQDAKLEFDRIAEDAGQARLTDQDRLVAAISEFELIGRPVKSLDHLSATRERLLSLRNSTDLSADDVQLVEKYLGEADNLGAEYHVDTARFYLKQGELESAVTELREVIENYPDTPHVQVANELILFINGEVKKLKASEETPAGPAADTTQAGEESK